MADEKLTAARISTPFVSPIADADLFYTVQDTGSTPESRAITGIELKNEILRTGWIPANQTWTYASATTITVPSGAASIYSVGDKIKLTQTTVKYFYVVGVADALLTITGGLTYTLTNAAITANYYAKTATAVGFPASMDWGGTAGHNVQGYSSVTTDTFSFNIIGKMVFCRVTTVGESNAGTMTGTLPVTPAFGTGQVGRIRDNSSAYQTGFINIISTTTATYYPTPDTAVAWTSSNIKGLYAVQFFYFMS